VHGSRIYRSLAIRPEPHRDVCCEGRGRRVTNSHQPAHDCASVDSYLFSKVAQSLKCADSDALLASRARPSRPPVGCAGPCCWPSDSSARRALTSLFISGWRVGREVACYNPGTREKSLREIADIIKRMSAPAANMCCSNGQVNWRLGMIPGTSRRVMRCCAQLCATLLIPLCRTRCLRYLADLSISVSGCPT
jgi:hypothetical protein